MSQIRLKEREFQANSPTLPQHLTIPVSSNLPLHDPGQTHNLSTLPIRLPPPSTLAPADNLTSNQTNHRFQGQQTSLRTPGHARDQLPTGDQLADPQSEIKQQGQTDRQHPPLLLLQRQPKIKLAIANLNPAEGKFRQLIRTPPFLANRPNLSTSDHPRPAPNVIGGSHPRP
jgi:hypothetical protein